MTPTPISPAIIGEQERFLLYGKPKVGKTFLALTLPPPIYFLTFGDAGEAKVFYSKPFQAKFGDRLKAEDLQIDVATTSQHAKDLATAALEADEKGTGFQFNSIIIDSVSELIEYQLDTVMNRIDMVIPDKDADNPHKGEWGKAQNIMRTFVSEVYAVPKHLAMVAHEYETMAPGPQQTSVVSAVSPWFIGKQRTDMGRKFDNVWRITREGDMVSARTDGGHYPRGGYDITAGSRIGGVISKDFDNPDLTKAIKIFREHADKMEAKGKTNSK
jgi:hypothetical protein